MEMKFHGLEFELDNNKLYLINVQDFAKRKSNENYGYFKFIECQVAGENHPYHCGSKLLNCSESNRLSYSSYAVRENKLEIITKSPLGITFVSNFQAYDDCKVIRTWNSVYNDANKPFIVEHLSALRFAGFGEKGADSMEDINVYVFRSSWHCESQVHKMNLKESCFYNGNTQSMKRFLISNTGSWSTKEYLPQAIIEDKKSGKFFFFQIESSSSWSFEISDEDKMLYLNVGGANMIDNQASFKIEASPNGSLYSKAVAFVVGNSINEVIQEMTKYRRHIVRENFKDADLPVIFNEYMHLSWDGPEQERTEYIAEQLKDFGIKYYVVDCGWHDECDVNEIYKECGEWIESKRRFPKGVKRTATKLKTFGMKLGLWIEPEIIGYKNTKMAEFYGDDAFFKRNGETIVMSNRKFLDFRNPKVISYLNNTIDRVVNDYGASYIKLDYNQDCGPGTETDAISLGEGLSKASIAYKQWIDLISEKYPHVIIETCSSGGCRMDYDTLSSFTIVSTSDQTNFRKYPYIVSNILSAVLPEQAGVWSYPIDCAAGDRIHEPNIKEFIDERISREQVAMNMMNTFLGRMHLASAIFLLSEEKQNIVKEGINYYNSLTKAKKTGVPYLPLGFSHFGDTHVASGFISKKVLYLGAWNLDGDLKFDIPLKEVKPQNVTIKYPSYSEAKAVLNGNTVEVTFKNSLDCVFLEIGLA